MEIQDIIKKLNEKKEEKTVKKAKKSGKKLKKVVNEDYLLEIIKKEKKDKPSISIVELSNKLGETQEKVEEIIKDISEDLLKVKKLKKKKSNSWNKFKQVFRKTFLDQEDKKTLKEFISKVLLIGIPLNFAFFVISKGFFPFTFYSWIGWGIAFHFIKKELVNIVRSMWTK